MNKYRSLRSDLDINVKSYDLILIEIAMLQTKLNFWTKYNKIVLGPIRYQNCTWSDSSENTCTHGQLGVVRLNAFIKVLAPGGAYVCCFSIQNEQRRSKGLLWKNIAHFSRTILVT